MKVNWNFSREEIARVKDFVQSRMDNPLVSKRAERNLATDKPPITRSHFWNVFVACLLTTQQRSGPTSAVTKFLSKNPFPLCLEKCDCEADLATYAKNEMQQFGGLRFTTKIPKFLQKNLPRMTGSKWAKCEEQLDFLRSNQTIEAERKVARFFDDRFAGFGPKQARNLLQILGLTRYEIPLDSRVAKWLKEFGFGIPVSSQLLLHSDYYEFVEDAIHALCRACEVFPCVLDAAIFASFDREEWTADLAVW